jgi:hypothetical protein
MVREPTPRPVVVIEAILFFLAVSAVAGGVGLIFGGEMFPSEWLLDIPLVTSWLVPGLVLGVGFGVGSLVVGFGMLRRWRWHWLGFVERWTGEHWSWAATVVIGLSHMVWIALELIYIPEPSWLQIIYGAVGIALFALPWRRAARSSLAVS